MEKCANRNIFAEILFTFFCREMESKYFRIICLTDSERKTHRHTLAQLAYTNVSVRARAVFLEHFNVGICIGHFGWILNAMTF